MPPETAAGTGERDGAADRAIPPFAEPPGRLGNTLFWPLWLGLGLALRLCFRLRVEGPRPPRGACVLAANHTSFLDPLLLGAAVPRRIAFLMTTVFWRSRAFGWFYRWNRAIPVAASGGNRDALRAARSVLEQGRTIGIFPEGGLSRDGLPMLGNPGAVALVLQAGAPIVPVAIVGAASALPPGARFLRFPRITIRFGAPLPAAELESLGGADRRARLQAATRTLMDRIAALAGVRSREQEIDAAR